MKRVLCFGIMVLFFLSGVVWAKNVDDYMEEGLKYKENRQYDKALESYEKAIEIDPNLSNAFSRIGNVYAAQHNNEKAIEFYNKAIFLSQVQNLV